MKIKEIHALSDEDITGKLKELKMELIKFNAQIAVGTNPKSPGLVKKTKKLIAKMIQEAHMRKLKGANVPTQKVKDKKPEGVKNK